MSDTGNPLLPPTDVTVSDVVDHEVDPRKKAQLQALGQKDAGWFGNLWAHLWASCISGVTVIIAEFADSLDQVLAFTGKFFLEAQGEKNPHFWDFAAVVLEDLTGVEVDQAALKQASYGSGRLKAMEVFGSDLYKELEKEFAPASGNLEEGSTGPAETFLGFLMSFAIRQGNVEMLTSFLPEEMRIGEGFRAYGELMAKNLGLGRMARRALQPLIQILVSDPLTYKLQEQYRPKRIGSTSAIKKFFKDPTFETQMRKELGQEGFTDARIDDLIADLRPPLETHELININFRRGGVTVSVGGQGSLDLPSRLAQKGYTAEDVDLLIEASRPILEKGEIALLFTNGVMDHQTASAYLGKLGYDNDTAELVLQAHAFQHQRPHKLGLGELKKAFHNSVIDLLELNAELTSQGYSPDDIKIITLDLLQPPTGKVRQLSLAEIKAGFKAGALTEAQAAEHLKTLGYSDSDIAVILQTLTPPKAATTAPAPTSSVASPAATDGGISRTPG